MSPAPSLAQEVGVPEPPPPLSELHNIPKLNTIVDEETGLPFDIRRNAMREAALSYGARGGLAWRTFEIRQELETRTSFLDKVFDFRQLLIPAPSGLVIEPPIITEAMNAMIIDNTGTNAAVADLYLYINENARIASTARTWRAYLERNWGEVTPPPDVLRPNNDEERELWIDLVDEGWKQGIDQANEIFRQDLARLESDFRGMVRYRMLLAQGMVSPPFALQVDRGITGGGREMRVGDRAVQITGMPALKPGYDQWNPANR
ncbi:MAG: type IV secretion system protein DotC [Alphaproteobacteria bacterium]|nr:type IV secretion system protein DotC [Alphaproteobacteria bacterium]